MLARVAVVVGLVLAAGCGGDDDAVVGGGATTTTIGAGPGTEATGTSAAGDEETGPAAPRGDGAGAPAGGGGSSSDPVEPPAFDPAGGGAPAPTLDASGPPGSFARAVLRPDLSQQIVLEVHVAPGAEPSAATLEHVRATLAAVTGKPTTLVTTPAPGDDVWTDAGLRQAADAGATTAQGAGTAVLRLLFLRGTYEGEGGVLGVAVRGDVAAVFADRTASAAGLLGDPQAIAVAVATHEVGHLLGLVDLVLATGRADPEHPGHSSNPASVMYWAVESDLVASVLGARPPRDFDGDDLADLRAIAAGA